MLTRSYMHVMKWSHLVAQDNRNSKWISPLYSTAIYPKCTYTLYSVFRAKTKSPIIYLCLDLGFLQFSSNSPSEWLLSSRVIFPSLCHHHLVCTNLAHITTWTHEVSTLGCHPINQNQTRAFNLPLFGNWWQPFTKIGFSIKVCELPLLVQAFKSKDMIWTNNTSSVW